MTGELRSKCSGSFALGRSLWGRILTTAKFSPSTKPASQRTLAESAQALWETVRCGVEETNTGIKGLLRARREQPRRRRAADERDELALRQPIDPLQAKSHCLRASQDHAERVQQEKIGKESVSACVAAAQSRTCWLRVKRYPRASKLPSPPERPVASSLRQGLKS